MLSLKGKQGSNRIGREEKQAVVVAYFQGPIVPLPKKAFGFGRVR
jgi:hypothetical protein